MGPIGWPETSVFNYQAALRNIPEERRSQQTLFLINIQRETSNIQREKNHTRIRHGTAVDIQESPSITETGSPSKSLYSLVSDPKEDFSIQYQFSFIPFFMCA